MTPRQSSRDQFKVVQSNSGETSHHVVTYVTREAPDEMMALRARSAS